MRSVLALILTMATVGAFGVARGEKQRYQATILDYFDTVSAVTGYEDSEEAFNARMEWIRGEMEAYDHLYDIYHEYPGMVNLCSVNAHPGETLTVDQRIIDLLLYAREVDDFSGHRTDAMMGSVLAIWHEAREAGIQHPEAAALPEEDALRAAAEHTGFDRIEIDPESRTVRLTDPAARIDVGALAKGYAVQKICEGLPEGYLLSVGGNVAATGPKPGGSPWVIGIQDPDSESDAYLHKVNLTKGAVVTSGDYRRMFTVDGKTYHHIIDPETLYPGTRWRAVTIICPDSGLGDALSTSLFLMTREEGQALLDRFGAVAVWIQPDGTQLFSPGYEAYIKP